MFRAVFTCSSWSRTEHAAGAQARGRRSNRGIAKWRGCLALDCPSLRGNAGGEPSSRDRIAHNSTRHSAPPPRRRRATQILVPRRGSRGKDPSAPGAAGGRDCDAITPPTYGERSIARARPSPRFGTWVQPGQNAQRAPPSGSRGAVSRAAAEAISAAEDGPLDRATLREIQAIGRPKACTSARRSSRRARRHGVRRQVRAVGTVWQ